MQGANLHIKKGSIFAYRLYDVASEIDLPKAQALLEQAQTAQNVRRYKLKNDPLRTIMFRQEPLIIASDVDEDISILIKEKEEPKVFKMRLEIKVWDYGVISLSYRINLTEDLLWKDLVSLGAILDSDSIIDELSKKKRDEIINQIHGSLKKPETNPLYEDYTTYLIEELETTTTKTEQNPEGRVTITDPLEALKKASVAELLLAETKRSLSDSTKKSVLSNVNQYTKKDLLVMDWNSSVVFDFTKEKEYQDYIDIIEFSQAQLLELQVYDQLIDEKLDSLYNNMEQKDSMKSDTKFYSKMSQESASLYMEFSDVFEKIDNSIKTIGDFYLAKILKTADKRFGFEDFKKTMLRKIEVLANISKMMQDKVDSLANEKHNKAAYRNEIIIILLISIEIVPLIYTNYDQIMGIVGRFFFFLNF